MAESDGNVAAHLRVTVNNKCCRRESKGAAPRGRKSNDTSQRYIVGF